MRMGQSPDNWHVAATGGLDFEPQSQIPLLTKIVFRMNRTPIIAQIGSGGYTKTQRWVFSCPGKSEARVRHAGGKILAGNEPVSLHRNVSATLLATIRQRVSDTLCLKHPAGVAGRGT
jgi:hypothetical protein